MYAKSIHSLLFWCYGYLKKLKDKRQISQSKRSGEKAHHIYTTYKTAVIPHVRHIYAKASDMKIATMCTNTHSDNALQNWKCVLRCCAECTLLTLI